MNKYLLVLILVFSAGFVLAQGQTQTPAAPQAPASPEAAKPADTKPLSEVLGWMVGNWEGEGMSRGEREFLGRMTAAIELDGEALLIRRESMNKAGGPSGGLKEVMVIGVDGTTKKIILTLYNSNNFIGLYVGELRGNEIVFSAATAQQGYVDRRTFKQLPDGGVSFFTEGASPGKEVSKLVEINFHKKA